MRTSKAGGFLLIAAAVVFLAARYLPAGFSPTPDEVKPVATSFDKAFDEGFAGQDVAAVTWSGLFNGLAAFIEADGKTSKPLLETMLDIEQLREAALAAPIKPVYGGPVIAAAIGPKLKELGTSNEKLSEGGRREAVVALFQEAAVALER